LNEGYAAQIWASVGVAVFPEDAHDPESLFIAADKRMYNSKHIPQKPRVQEPVAKLAASSLPKIQPIPDPILRTAD